MKKTLIYLSLIAVLASCSKKHETGNSSEALKADQMQMDSLMKVKKDLDSRIKDLQAKIDKEKGDSTASGELVTIDTVQAGKFISYIDLQASVDAKQNITVTPQMPGSIQEIYVTEGEHVSKGQVMAEIDNATYKKQIETLQTQLAYAQDLYNKQKALWDQKIGTEVQFLTAKNNVETLQKQIAAANQQLEQTKLIAPIDGIVDEVDIKTGQIAAPGMNGIRVVNMNTLKVDGEVSEAYASLVNTGDKVKLQFPDLDTTIDSKLSFVSKVINPQSRTFTAEAQIPSEGKFKPNMVVVMKIADYERDNVVSIDLNLLQKSSNGRYVYVVSEENGKAVAKRRPLEVGKIYGGKAEILSGLMPGDRIIIAGYQDVVDGQEIRFE